MSAADKMYINNIKKSITTCAKTFDHGDRLGLTARRPLDRNLRLWFLLSYRLVRFRRALTASFLYHTKVAKKQETITLPDAFFRLR